MERKTVTIVVVVAVVAVLVGGGIAAILNNINGKESEPAIKIVDGSGRTIGLSEPIDSCMVVNTNVPIAMRVLGLQDKVQEILFYGDKKYEYFKNAGFDNITESAPSAKNLTNAEYFITHNIKYVIEPVSSMKLSTTVEKACDSAGITYIRLNCYGETMLEDMEKLLTLFGNTETIRGNYNSYLNLSQTVTETVLSKCSPSQNDLFLFYYMSFAAFYNQTSELSKITESIFGSNATRKIDGLNLNGISNQAPRTGGIQETLTGIDGSTPIRTLFIRMSANSSVEDAKYSWNGYSINCYKFSYMDDGTGNSRVFSIDSDLLSGPMGYIGYVALAEIVGIDTGYSIQTLLSEYTSLYGFQKPLTGMVYQLVFDGMGVCTDAIDITTTV